jgi:toxin ParE1/3/4
MKPVRFHPEAETEMIDAAAWYQSQQRDLGRRLLAAAADAIQRIQLHPELFPIVDGDVRRSLTRTIPFGVLFRNRPEVIEVLAVMHLHREPGYWAKRRDEGR